MRSIPLSVALVAGLVVQGCNCGNTSPPGPDDGGGIGGAGNNAGGGAAGGSSGGGSGGGSAGGSAIGSGGGTAGGSIDGSGGGSAGGSEASSGGGAAGGSMDGSGGGSAGGSAIGSGGGSAGGTATSAGGGTAGGSAAGAGGGTAGGSAASSGGGSAGGSSAGAGGGMTGGTGGGSAACNPSEYLNGAACTPLTVCTAAQYQSVAPTSTSDRVCTPLTVCTAAQYQSVAPTTTSDRACTPLTLCTVAQYQSVAPTSTSDRVCLAVTTCTAAQYQSAAPTPTSDRVCTALTVCTPTQYQSVAPTPTSDRVCTAQRACLSSEYETMPPTATTDRVCAPLTVCSSSQCEMTPPTPTTDRVCAPLTLVLTPPGLQTLTADVAQPSPTTDLAATACGQPVNAAWTLDVGAIGTITPGPSSSATFTPSLTVGGLVNVIAGYQGQTASAQVFVMLTGTQNGANVGDPREAAQVPSTVGALVQGGGVNGVGGEGLGVTLSESDPSFVALANTPTSSGAAQGLKLLYPYDGTVWPRGMLAPLLQWDWSLGDADAVRIDLATASGSFQWTGTFGRPAILASLPAATNKFVRHPIPQDMWDIATNTAGGPTPTGQRDTLTVTVTVARGGVAYGPLSQTWIVAPARPSGTIYYQSYGTNLASNYSGALGTPSAFGAAVLSIRAGDAAPKLVSSATSCQVCHSVASKGGRLLTNASTNNDDDSWQYTLSPSGATNSMLSKGVVFPGYPALYPDGTMMLTPSGALQSLPDNSGADLPSSGLSSVASGLGLPAFSPDGLSLVFNPQDTVTHPGRELMVMSFNKLTGAFTSPVVVVDDAIAAPGNPDIRSGWPAFFPDSKSLVYQHQLRRSVDGNLSDLRTRKFAQGQLYWSSAVASAAAQPLNQLNGFTADGGTKYLPTLASGVALSCTADGTAVGNNAGSDGDITHALDPSYNYEPTVNPVSSGGYAWVVFTSRRMYGNVATIPPFCSDPRGVDLHADMVTNTNVTTKKLWVAAIDLNAAPGTDPSHPAFYLPAQEFLAGNARGFWVLDPCRNDNASCETGDQCCNGFCEPNGTNGALVCSTKPPNYSCSALQEPCSVKSDCCTSGAACIGGLCALD